MVVGRVLAEPAFRPGSVRLVSTRPWEAAGDRGVRRSDASAQPAYQRQVAAQQRQAVQADKAAMAQQLADAFLRILALHQWTSRRRSTRRRRNRRYRTARRSTPTTKSMLWPGSACSAGRTCGSKTARNSVY